MELKTEYTITAKNKHTALTTIHHNAQYRPIATGAHTTNIGHVILAGIINTVDIKVNFVND